MSFSSVLLVIWRLLKVVGGLLALVLLVGFIYYSYEIYQARLYTAQTILPDLEKRQWRHPNGVPKVFEISNDDLSEKQREILIKVQDPGFYDHNGIDLSTPGAGLTTITQAITKKLYFERFKPGLAKIYQSLVARFVVDDLISKEDQLTVFLNSMYYGRHAGQSAIGLNSAANVYYGVAAPQLSDDEYISLIAMIVMPNTFHVVDHADWNKDRSNRIKALIAGEYTPQGLMDQFYGKLPQAIVDAGLPPASYFKNSLQPKKD